MDDKRALLAGEDRQARRRLYLRPLPVRIAHPYASAAPVTGWLQVGHLLVAALAHLNELGKVKWIHAGFCWSFVGYAIACLWAMVWSPGRLSLVD